MNRKGCAGTEHPAHNRMVPGSSPGGPTIRESARRPVWPRVRRGFRLLGRRVQSPAGSMKRPKMPASRVLTSTNWSRVRLSVAPGQRGHLLAGGPQGSVEAKQGGLSRLWMFAGGRRPRQSSFGPGTGHKECANCLRADARRWGAHATGRHRRRKDRRA